MLRNPKIGQKIQLAVPVVEFCVPGSLKEQFFLNCFDMGIAVIEEIDSTGNLKLACKSKKSPKIISVYDYKYFCPTQ